MQPANAVDKDSFVMGANQNYKGIDITPENASRYGIRLYMTGDIFKTDFKVKIVNNWKGSKYIGHTVLVGMEDSYLKYSGFGCKADNKGVFFLISALNNKIDKTILNLDYLMSKDDLKKEKITVLNINLKAFIAYKDQEPDLYVEH